MRSVKHCLRLGAILTGISLTNPAGLARAADAGLRITVRVRNYAYVEAETMMRAQQEVRRIYGEIGVETLWIDPDDSHPYPPRPIDLNIIPRALEKLGARDGSLGITPGEGPNRVWVYVFYDRVEDLAHKQLAAVAQKKFARGATSAQILGYAMAHEIGHLLGLRHSPVGIMRAGWRWNDLLDLAYGDLVFTPQEAAVVRAEVQMRQQP